ncbi:hypothetical protein J3U11_11260 [Gilliamella sp. B2840]|uniref:hypothetical protein n=1 Tax=unclassified Gilliamella TaxID=2685620 RepID=UPI00226A96B8|nr:MULTISPECIES: hypothetical protein [unclassified Gilliamella]MCX8665983.1 hypothetical protein [Gilliamella sp. B2887]MCX8696562.1 hypothetical protein [Gilliamella sp. B2828]MCX8698307.1 hypothetical protein [Gilliamella sp. B3000]MCX8701652.1 hypothetical protein [Gilliamella sp. B2840]
MSLFEQFETDKNKEQEGVAIEYGANKDGTIPTFYIGRIGGSDSAYHLRLKKLCAPFRRQIELDIMQNSKMLELQVQAFTETTLKGWSNVLDRNDSEIQFTKNNAIILFNQLPDLFADLISQSTNIELFKRAEMEENLKN